MAKIAFLLLAHRDPARVAEQVRALTAHGDCVAVHFDRRSDASEFRALRNELAGVPGVAFARRVRCGWGMWSLVQATLNMARCARRSFDGITHYYLLSGDCYPTKSRGYLDRWLGENTDVIETHDFHTGGWIRTGLKEERLVYRHWFNERERPGAFYAMLNLQRRMGWRREPPQDLKMRIGSQWWALRASTVEKLLGFMRRRPDVVRFFRTTWIPDESMFQTLVSHLVPAQEIRQGPPTHLIFSDYGKPVVFHDDHYGYLRADDRPFARKLSPEAAALRGKLLDAFRQRESDEPEGGGSGRLYGYLAGRGRQGQRYAPRFWERGQRPHRDAELMLVVCKLWHVGAAVERAAAAAAGLRSLGYLFDEDHDLDLPLGGLERGLAKRGRHRRALLDAILEVTGERRLIMALDPSRADAAADLSEVVGQVRILLVERPVKESHVLGHARRVGLLAPTSGAFEQKEATVALTREFAAEAETLRHDFRGRLWVNRLDRAREANAADIAHFLRIPRDAAEPVAAEAERHPH